MRTLLAVLVVAAAAPAVAPAQDQPSGDELVEKLKRVLRDATSNVETFETNGYRVETEIGNELGADLKPTGRAMALLNVTADEMFRVGVEKGRDGMSRGGGVALFHRKTGQPMLVAGDRDGDGRIDVVEYDVLDETGEIAMSVVDYEADGQPDMRVNFKEHYFEIWSVDRWYRVEKRDGRQGIVVNGDFVELEKRGERLVPRTIVR